MQNEIFRKIIEEISSELGISVNFLSDGWVMRLERNGETHFIIGNRFELNSASCGSIADDKVATFEILKSEKIPAVSHFLIYNPAFSKSGEENPLDEIFNKRKYPVVVKPNEGSHGRGVSLCKTPVEAIEALKKLFLTEKSVAVSEFFPSKFEYRCFFLNGEIILIYQKNRQDGEWRHNLSKGATPKIIDKKSEIFKRLSTLAANAGRAIRISFATIDILESEASNELKVLEINQGVSASIFASLTEKNYDLAKNIYRKALKAQFKI